MLITNASTRIYIQDSILGVPLVEPQDIADDCRDLERLLRSPKGQQSVWCVVGGVVMLPVQVRTWRW